MVTAAAAKKTPAKGRKTPGKKPTPPQVHPDFILSRSIYHELAAAAQELESEINQVEDQIKFIKGDYREDPKKFEMASRVAWSTLDSRAKFVLMNIRDAIEMILDAVIEIDADHEKPDSFTDNFRDFYKKLEGTISIQEKALDGKTLKGVLKDLEKAADLIPSEIGKPSSQGKLRDSIDVMMEIWKTLTGKAPKAPNFETAVPRYNPDQLTMFASNRIARVVARYSAQIASDPMEPVKQKRLSPQQKKALAAYRFAEQQEDRYLGSVFATKAGQKKYEELTRLAYEECKRLGMGVEHGL